MFRFIVPFHFVQFNKNFSKSRKSKICKQVKWKACPLSILKLSSVSRKICINKPLSNRPVSWFNGDSSNQETGILGPFGFWLWYGLRVNEFADPYLRFLTEIRFLGQTGPNFKKKSRFLKRIQDRRGAVRGSQFKDFIETS